MPRKKSDNEHQVALRIPKAWIERAQALTSRIASPGVYITRTDVLRAAIALGLEQLERSSPPRSSRGVAPSSVRPLSTEARGIRTPTSGRPP